MSWSSPKSPPVHGSHLASSTALVFFLLAKCARNASSVFAKPRAFNAASRRATSLRCVTSPRGSAGLPDLLLGILVQGLSLLHCVSVPSGTTPSRSCCVCMYSLTAVIIPLILASLSCTHSGKLSLSPITDSSSLALRTIVWILSLAMSPSRSYSPRSSMSSAPS